jgi:hypothetical protein
MSPFLPLKDCEGRTDIPAGLLWAGGLSTSKARILWSVKRPDEDAQGSGEVQNPRRTGHNPSGTVTRGREAAHPGAVLNQHTLREQRAAPTAPSRSPGDPGWDEDLLNSLPNLFLSGFAERHFSLCCMIEGRQGAKPALSQEPGILAGIR